MTARWILAATLMTGSSAFAGLPNPVELHLRVHDAIHDQIRRDVRRLVRVPLRLHAAHREALREFAGRASWDRAHRHYHDVYRLPVVIDGRRDYRSYSYCNGHAAFNVSVELPYLAIEIGRPTHYQRRVYDRRYRDRGYGCHEQRSQRDRHCDDDCHDDDDWDD